MFDLFKKKGRWVEFVHQSFSEVLCSRCGFELMPMELNGEDIMFYPERCPNCGRKMKVDKSLK